MNPDAAELLLDELKDAHDREEILAFLRFEVTRHRSSYTPAQVEAMGSACWDISRHLWRPPKWFIPPYEVEFNPRESRVCLGSFWNVARYTRRHQETHTCVI